MILTERSASGESPDAIGWTQHSVISILIECKATRADFKADSDKLFRDDKHSRWGMGRYRYYFTPPRLIHASELPPGWGLIEVLPTRCRLVRMAAEQPDYARNHEMQLMWGELAKYQLAWAGVTLWPCQAKASVEGTVNHFKAVEAVHRQPFVLKRRKKKHGNAINPARRSSV